MRHAFLRPLLLYGIIGTILITSDYPATAQSPVEETGESSQQAEDAIRGAGEAYVAAFNARDAKKLAGFWSPEAVYTNRLTGEQVRGREAIMEQFKEVFATEKDLKLKVETLSLDFVSPNVAVEKGIATFLSSQAPESVDYSAVYIQRDGKWLLDRVTDDPQPVVASRYEQLKPLEWMIGSWVDEGDSGRVTTVCSWTKNQTYITRSFTVTTLDRVELSGIQFIGWDPIEKQIRSWTFDSDGGFSNGQWSQDGDRWYIKKRGTTADGDRATALNIVTAVDEDTFTLQSRQRTVGGQLLPNIDEVIVVRK